MKLNEPDYQEKWPDIIGLLKNNIRKNCNRHLILNRFPITKWLPKYRPIHLFEDFVAGVTVGLTVVPQGIAYAAIAGLPAQYGLYSAFVGCFVYCLLGTCKDVTIGPTAILALMIQKYVKENPDFAILSAFLSGVIILAFGLLNLGFMVQFISLPVTTGFTSAAALTIGSSQIKPLLGLPGSANDFVSAWENFFLNVDKTRLWDTVLGVGTIVFLLGFQKLKDVKGRWAGLCKYIALSRNAVAVLIGTLLAYYLTNGNDGPFALTGDVVAGFPSFQPPPFSTIIGNTTLEFADMVSNLSTSLIAIPLIAILETVAIAKAFSKGKTLDATQEMIALGTCNIIGSFFSSMPTTGSFSRTAINHSTGVRTTLGGIFTGSIVLLSLGFLTEAFKFIPKTTLAGIIISAMIFMVETSVAKEVWRTRRLDFLPFIVTMIACLWLGLEYGIIIGVILNILFILYSTARPKTDITHVKVFGQDVLVVVPDQSLFFAAAEHLKYKILKHTIANQDGSIVVVNGEAISYIDVTVAKTLQNVVEDLRLQNKCILFWNWKRQPVGVAWRLSKDLGGLFRQTITLEELVNSFKLNDQDGVISVI